MNGEVPVGIPKATSKGNGALPAVTPVAADGGEPLNWSNKGYLSQASVNDMAATDSRTRMTEDDV